jgi:hypothetical protein
MRNINEDWNMTGNTHFMLSCASKTQFWKNVKYRQHMEAKGKTAKSKKFNKFLFQVFLPSLFAIKIFERVIRTV